MSGGRDTRASVATGTEPRSGGGVLLVTGATGRMGGAVARALADRGVPLRALVRDTGRAVELRELGADIAVADLNDPATLGPALDGVDAALLCCADGPNQTELECGFVDAAVEHGVRRVVKISAQSAGAQPPVSFGRFHRASERHLQASELEWTVVRPTLLMQSLFLFAPAVSRGRLVAPIGRGRVAMVDLRDAAEVAVEAMISDVHAGEILEVTGPQALSFSQIAELLAAATGHRVRHVSPPAALARIALPVVGGMSRWEAGQVVDLMTALRHGLQSEVKNTVESVTGAPARTLADFCSEHAVAFAAGPPSQR